MRLYLAITASHFYDSAAKHGYPDLLFSFHFLSKSAKLWRQMLEHEGSLLIDSGAYSAWRQGEDIDLELYIRACRQIADSCRASDVVFINLDRIPGEPDRPATNREVEQAVSESYRNWHVLREETGFSIMPVYHEGEDIEVLERYLGELADGEMIGISPRARMETKQVGTFYNQCFRRLRQPILQQGIRPHNLGVTASNVLKQYPFFSADSAIISMSPGMGRVATFDPHRGQMRNFSYKDRHKHTPETLRGVDSLNKRNAEAERRDTFVQSYLEYRRYLSRLWASRGIVWEGSLGSGNA